MTLLRIWLLVWLSLVPFPLVGRWSGIRPRPTMIMPSDVMYRLHHDIMHRRLVEVVLFFHCKSEFWITLCLNFKCFAETPTWLVIFRLCLSSAAKPNSDVLADFQNLLNYFLCTLNSVCNIFQYTSLLCKKWCNVVISGPAFVWAMFALPILEAKWFLSGFYPRDCRYESSEVRVKPHLPLRWWLAHLSRFCRAVLP